MIIPEYSPRPDLSPHVRPSELLADTQKDMRQNMEEQTRIRQELEKAGLDIHQLDKLRQRLDWLANDFKELMKDEQRYLAKIESQQPQRTNGTVTPIERGIKNNQKNILPPGDLSKAA